MATYTAPTTRTTGALISASIWNTDIVENLKYFKDAPVFDGDISVGDDIFLTSTGAVINFASGDVTLTHSTNTLTFAGASSGYIFNDGNVGIGGTPGSVRLDLINSLNAIRVSDVTTDATTKQGKWLQRHYTNAEEDVMVAFTLSTSTDNLILIGGGSGAQNAATQISFYTAANNTVTTGTERMRIPAAGGVQCVTTLSVGNATPAATGAGITFPAAQSASSDANTLDDYEEGTWTATLKGSTTDPTTPVTATGSYTKIGRQVTVRCQFTGITTTGAAGAVTVTGLPFSVGATGIGAVMLSDFNLGGGNGPVCYGAGTTVEFYTARDLNSWNLVTHSAGAGRYLWFSLTYFV